MNATAQPHRRFYGWANAGLLFFVQFAAIGFVYLSYAVVFPEMITATGWSRDTASIGQSAALVLFGMFYPLTAWMIGRLGVKNTLTVGLLVLLAALALIVFAVTEVWQWNLVWGLVFGLSLALTGPICAQTVMIAWFNIRRATAIGLVLTGSAIGGAVAQPLLTFIMEQWESWRAGWATGIVTVSLAVIVTRFIVNRPGDIGQFPDNIDPGAAPDAPAEKHAPRTYRTAHDWTLGEIFRNRTVYLLMFVSSGYLITLTFVLSHGALHFRDNGVSEIEAASILGTVILGSGLGRLPAGWLGDHFELRWVTAAYLLAMLGSFALFWHGTGFAVLMTAAILFGVGYGSMLVLLPAVMGNYFGEKIFPAVNSAFAPLMLPFAAAAPIGAGFIFERTDSYDIAFGIGLVMLGLALIAAILLTAPKPPMPA